MFAFKLPTLYSFRERLIFVEADEARKCVGSFRGAIIGRDAVSFCLLFRVVRMNECVCLHVLRVVF